MQLFILITSCLVLLISCSNESTTTAVGDALPEAESARIEAHIKFLADDTLQGRDTGSVGYAIAANYVASQFAQIGVQPAGVVLRGHL